MTAAGERLIAAAKEMRTMAKIPEDIIKAGRRCYDGLGRGSVSDSEHIARAILAAEKRGEERGEERERKALEYATRLLVTLMEKHYPDRHPEWAPFPDLYGVLTQINNLSTGLVRAAAIRKGSAE